MKEIYSSVLVLATTKTEVIRSENIHRPETRDKKEFSQPEPKMAADEETKMDFILKG